MQHFKVERKVSEVFRKDKILFLDGYFPLGWILSGGKQFQTTFSNLEAAIKWISVDVFMQTYRQVFVRIRWFIDNLPMHRYTRTKRTKRPHHTRKLFRSYQRWANNVDNAVTRNARIVDQIKWNQFACHSSPAGRKF